MSDQAAQFAFPSALVTRADLARLIRELEAIDNELESQKVRAAANPGQAVAYRLPTMSRSLSDFIEQNKLDLSSDKQRLSLREQLRTVKDKVPVMHMTFAVEADPEFLQQLTTWIRANIHPQALLSVGLQPSIVGGVYLRTPNHVHDYSIRELLASKRSIIADELEQLMWTSTPVAAPPTSVPSEEQSREG